MDKLTEIWKNLSPTSIEDNEEEMLKPYIGRVVPWLLIILFINISCISF